MSMIQQVQLTKSGYDFLKAELEELVNLKRPRLVERLANARREGDLSENSDYSNAKEELEFLDGRIAELQTVIKNAKLVDDNVVNRDSVAVGTEVTLGLDGEKHIYKIVGEWEADPVAKKISHMSPLGQSLLGKKIGEKVEVEAPAGKILYTILGIN